ncbi:hypothetical protein [Luteitalea pratensis]|nr:hypothetical protein [Luteitalea pratensis]
MPPCQDGTYAKRDLRAVVAWIVVALLVGVGTPACAPKVTRRQTDIMENLGKVSVSAAVLRARVNDLADRFAGRIEESADRIEGETKTVDARRRALALKVDVIPAVYTAGYRVDPLAAAIDVWVLAFQFGAYVQTGAGRDLFGAQQELVQAAARDVIADADTVLRSVVSQPEYFDSARGKVETWARTHPIAHTFGSRPSGSSVLAELKSDERDAFLAVGSASDTLENLSERLNTYATQLPKQARWHSEILASELTAEIATALAIDRTIPDIHDVGAAARGASGVLSDLNRLFDVERAMLEVERRAVLAGIDQQRLESLDFVTSERHALVAAIREERLALVAALRQERIEAIAEIDAIKTRAVDTSLAGLKNLVDYTFWRVAVLLTSLLCVAALFGAIALWLLLRRARVPATS